MARIKALNLTPYKATMEELGAGAIDISDVDREKIRKLFDFGPVTPTTEMIHESAIAVANFADEFEPKCNYAIVGGDTYMITAVVKALLDRGVRPCYPYYKRAGETGLVFVDWIITP